MMGSGMWIFKRKGEHIDPVALTEYMDGCLPARKRERMELHLESCSRCSEELESLRHTVGLLRQVPMAAPRRVFTLAGAPPPVLAAPRVMVPAWGYGAGATAAVILFAVIISADLGGVLDRQGSDTSQAASEAAGPEGPAGAQGPAGPAGPASPQGGGAQDPADGDASTPSGAGTEEASPEPGLAAAEDTALKFEAEAEPDAAQPADQERKAIDEAESEEEQAAPRPPQGTPAPDESRSAAVAGAPPPSAPKAEEGQQREERATLSEKVDIKVVRATLSPVPTDPPAAEGAAEDLLEVPGEALGGGTSILWRVLEGVLGAAALFLVATFLWRMRRLRSRAAA